MLCDNSQRLYISENTLCWLSLISTRLEITQLLPLIDKANNWNILLFKDTCIIETHRPSLKCGMKVFEELSCFKVFSEKSFSKRLYHQLVEVLCKPVDWLLYVAFFIVGYFRLDFLNTVLITLHQYFAISYSVLLTLKTF